MKRLTNEQIMDYLDGALSPAEMQKIEAHLEVNQEDAECIRDLQMAMGAVQEWHTSEPLRVSDNFWPSVRDQLGPAPKRPALSQLGKSLTGLFGTAPTARWSMGAAFAAIVIALGALLFSPQHATTPVMALTPADQTFIQQSVQRHEAYIASQPVAGDVASAETGADDTDEDTIR